ncbi:MULTISPECIES: ABC transporter substrate-binding protein [unclassified Mesorhizobium]|uniref:ABC transporter substrate-binding protein n=1 Tax=unclassified Mesorhizobium TaxID=325217 RepID=UPI003014DC85
MKAGKHSGHAMSSTQTRRDFIAAGIMAASAVLAPASGFCVEQASGPQRIIALDWGLAETLLALGVKPLAIPEVRGYRNLVDPDLPETVQDIGLRTEPNLELMRRLDPDLILVNPGYAGIADILGRIASVETYSIFDGSGKPFDNARKALVQIATVTGRSEQARLYLEETTVALEQLKASANDFRGRPVYLVTMIDERHLMIHGNNGLFQHVLDVAGLRNAWDQAGNIWGYSNAGIERLKSEPDALVINLGPVPAYVQIALKSSRLWSSLPFNRRGQFHTIPSLWTFGALPSAVRFSWSLTDILRGIPHAG